MFMKDAQMNLIQLARTPHKRYRLRHPGLTEYRLENPKKQV